MDGTNNPAYLDVRHSPSQKTMGVSPWMNALFGPAITLAKAGAAADSAEKMKDTTGVNPWRLHFETTGHPLLSISETMALASRKGSSASTMGRPTTM